MTILTIFKGFREKRTRIDLQGPIMLESRQNVKTRHLVWIYGEKSKIWNLITFDPLLSAKRPDNIF